MSTRASITVQNEEGQYFTIYNHFDGYLDGLGQLLLNNYNDLELAKKLVSHGDVSSVDTTVKLCEYYHRDRGEDWDEVKPRIDSTLEELSELLQGMWTDYNYLFKDGAWHYKTSYNDQQTFTPLTQQAIDDDGCDDE